MLSNIFHFGQISKFEKGRNFERKKNWIIISCGYAHLCIMPFITTTKFHQNLLSSFRGVALPKKQDWRTDRETDWLTDWLVKNIIPSATSCMGYNNKYFHVITLLFSNLSKASFFLQGFKFYKKQSFYILWMQLLSLWMQLPRLPFFKRGNLSKHKNQSKLFQWTWWLYLPWCPSRHHEICLQSKCCS